ncbi:hypothetical protein [Clostridium phage Maintenon]|nr:hypothetical protein [Clostridium phage Maintenon]
MHGSIDILLSPKSVSYLPSAASSCLCAGVFMVLSSQ